MPIEEKKRALEFTYTPDNFDGDLKYDIIYDDSHEVFPLRISCGGGDTDYPLNLFVEVVDFLTAKGVIQPRGLSRTVPTTFSSNEFPSVPGISNNPGSSIPLPQIQKKDGEKSPIHFMANTDPLASFDITTPLSHIDIRESPILPTPELVERMEHGPSLVGPVITHQNSIPEEAITRPVIRSRVNKGDPFSAEKDAATKRAMVSETSGKTIKRIEGD